MTPLLDGQLALTTPEGVRLLLTPAGPAPRALAWVIDLCVFLAAVWLLALVLSPSGKFGSGLFLLALFLVYWGYPVLCEVYGGGATLGKRALGLEVLRATGVPVDWRASMLRNLLLVADFLPIFYATGLACMLWDVRFRRLGDIVAGTLVVYRERAPRRVPAPDVPPLPLPFPLTPVQQSALADLFAREASLPVERMDELAGLAEPLTGRTGRASLERLRAMVAGLLR
jgi:uncharacterized RDD family membrane protein YckC